MNHQIDIKAITSALINEYAEENSLSFAEAIDTIITKYCIETFKKTQNKPDLTGIAVPREYTGTSPYSPKYGPSCSSHDLITTCVRPDCDIS